MTEQRKNPYIEPEDYFAGYRQSIEKLRNNPEYVEFDKMCYELFNGTPLGKKFIAYITERFIEPSLVPRNAPDYATSCIWAEGYKEAFRLLKNSVKAHSQRIKAEVNK